MKHYLLEKKCKDDKWHLEDSYTEAELSLLARAAFELGKHSHNSKYKSVRVVLANEPADPWHNYPKLK